MLSKDLIINVENDFNKYLTLFPEKSDEIRSIAKAVSKDLRVFFMKAITQMSATDIISVDLTDVFQHVIHIYKIINSLEYCKNLPIDIIFNFVLPYRANNEDFSLYAPYFYKELEELINPKNIVESALEVNYWCFSKATYAQADARTQNAMTTIRAGKGRCGEESVLLVSALRSVGIPSRQCYSPYWSHCDDNHAWVEVFTGDKWEFMGACEPEEKLNIAWFNNAASRALVVRHRYFELGERQIDSERNKIFNSAISTSVYGKTRELTVSLADENNPVSDAKIGLYVINYNIPRLVCEKVSDSDGKAVFEVGRGEFLAFSHLDGKYDIKNCYENEDSIILDLSKKPDRLEFNLVPYEGDISNVDFEQSQEHKDKMTRLLNKRINSHKKSSESENKFIQLSGLNSIEIQKFLDYPDISEENKNEILLTLTKKDYTDITFEKLCDMNFAYEYKDSCSDEIFKKYILPSRVENETIYEYKKYVKDFFADKNITEPQQIFDYINSNIRFLDDYVYTALVADIKGVLKNNIATSFSLPIHTVQILRALGIPARLNPVDRSLEYYDKGDFVSVRKEREKSSNIKFINKENLSYRADFTACEFDSGYFKFLNMSEELKNSDEVAVSPGFYAITQASRQIDGSVTGNLQFYFLEKGESISVMLDKHIDSTKEKLKKESIDESIVNQDGKIILGYIENGAEPTEHFLNELLEHEEQIKGLGINVILKGESSEKNNILSEVLNKGIASYQQSSFTKEWKELRRKMGVGDLRLPFITAVADKIGLFSFANYNVGTVDLLLKILKNKE